MKKVLITGIIGQDGSYLAELLLEIFYQVYGIIRRSCSFNTGRIDNILDKITLYYGDITDPLVIANQRLVEVDEKYFRPSEVDLLLGDGSLIYKELGRKPKTNLTELIKIMIESEVKK